MGTEFIPAQFAPITPLSMTPLNVAAPTDGARPEMSFGDMLASALASVNRGESKKNDGIEKLVTGSQEATHKDAIHNEHSSVLMHLTVQAASKMTSTITTLLQIQI